MSEFPQSLDRFEIIRILGKGGMGTVFLARDQRLDRQVALKVLHTDDLESGEGRSRFLNEARAAASVRHPNVATIYEVGETAENVPFLVMEYCEGETLSQRMRRKQLDAGEILSIARQMAAGVAAAHDNGIIHRDIKTANVILEPTGQVKILDFGLAKTLRRNVTPVELDSDTKRHFFGTLHYISPEQARGGEADMRSDLFSLGVVIYQMSSGHLPFNGESALAVLEKIRDAEPEPFTPLDPALPGTVAKIIGRLLQKNVKDRYQSAHDLQADLESIDTPTVRLTGTLSRSKLLGRTLHRPHWMRYAVVVVALVIVGTAVFFARTRSESPEPSQATVGMVMPIRSMAVLPFDNVAKNAGDDFLSVSLADALITKLQRIPSLKVRPTSAVLEFHDKKVDGKVASDRLHVDGILEGRFLAAGDLVRVNLQLTDSRTGYNVWAEQIDGQRSNLLKLIDDVSSRTVSALNDRLGVRQSLATHSEPRSTNPKAYEEYLKSRALTGSLLPKEHDAQIAALRKAIDLDPDFAAAYADLAIALSLGQARGMASDPGTLQRAQWYARQAIRLDPNLPEAHLALGRIFVRDPERYPESTRENLACLRLNPSEPAALNALTSYFVSIGDLPKAQCLGDKVVAIDPGSNESKTRGYWYINAIDPDSALRAADAALGTKETALAGRDVRALAFILQGNLAAAEKEADLAVKLVPTSYIGKSLKAMIAADRGDRATCEAQLEAFRADANRYHYAAIRQLLCYARLGDRDKAVAWLKTASDLGNHGWYALVKHPWLANLQADPEFQAITGKMKKDLDDVSDDVAGVYQLICGGGAPQPRAK